MKNISFDASICQSLDQALKKSWIETNAFGGYASSTLTGVNTSRHHGLLIGRLSPPLGPYVFLSTLEEILFVDETQYPFSTQFQADRVFPEGYLNLYEFSLIPFPTWTFRAEDLVIAKTLVFLHGEQTVLIRYQVLSGDENLVRLEVRALTAFREIHALQRRSDRMNTQLDLSAGRIRFAGLYFHHNAAIVDSSGAWYQRIQYPEEKKSGLEYEEDLYAPFRLIYTFQKEREIYLCASLADHAVIDPLSVMAREEERRFNRLKEIHVSNPHFQVTAFTSGAFLVNPSADHEPLSLGSEKAATSSKSFILATHFPWVGEDSLREILLSLHGFALTTGQYDISRRMLLNIAGRLHHGLLPKFFVPSPTALNQAEENLNEGGADLPLWFIHCIFEYLQYSGDKKTIEKSIFPALRSIIEIYLKGIHLNIRVDTDGLLVADSEHPSTWMDRRAGQWIITPRQGKAVEVQALWYNALLQMAHMAELFGEVDFKKTCEASAEKARKSFNSLFWDQALGYLYDVINHEMKDTSLRPNQLLALSLPFPIFEDDSHRWRSVLEAMKRHLLTPYGLRTLAPYESNYHGRCDGEDFRRNFAYHQGAVWTWFLIPYLRARLRLEQGSTRVKEEFLAYILPLLEHVEDRCLGFISEVFDAEAPHEGRGVPAHLLATASILELHEMLASSNSLWECRPNVVSPR